MSKSTTVIDNKSAEKPTLRLCVVEGERAEEPDRPAVFSSIKQTAVALATAARSQATRRARTSGRRLSDDVADAERLAAAVQRANVEQARRVADSTRAAFDALVQHTLHPCAAVDDTGRVVRWNGAIAAWTGIDAATALTLTVESLFAPEAAAAIHDAIMAARESAAENREPDADSVFLVDGAFALAGGGSAERVALIPLCRIAHVVEEMVLLITPAR